MTTPESNFRPGQRDAGGRAGHRRLRRRRSMAGADVPVHHLATAAGVRRRHRILEGSLDCPRRNGLQPLGRCTAAARRRTHNRSDAFGRWIEGRYRITPRIFLAGRADRLSFSAYSAAPRVPLRCRGMRQSRASKPAAVTICSATLSSARRSRRTGAPPDGCLDRTYVSAQIAYWF